MIYRCLFVLQEGYLLPIFSILDKMINSPFFVLPNPVTISFSGKAVAITLHNSCYNLVPWECCLTVDFLMLFDKFNAQTFSFPIGRVIWQFLARVK